MQIKLRRVSYRPALGQETSASKIRKKWNVATFLNSVPETEALALHREHV